MLKYIENMTMEIFNSSNQLAKRVQTNERLEQEELQLAEKAVQRKVGYEYGNIQEYKEEIQSS